MLVTNALELKITFLDVLARVLKEPSASRVYSPDGSAVTIPLAAASGCYAVLDGDNFEAGSDNGVVHSFRVISNGSPNVLDVQFAGPLSLAQLVETAISGAGQFSPTNYPDFYNLVLPPGLEHVVFTGHGGVDFALGSAGDDVIALFDGPDLVYLSEGHDKLDLGVGRGDRVSAAYLGNGVEANLARGFVLEANTGSSSDLTDVEDVVGGGFQDLIVGNQRDNRLLGEAGNDVLSGRAGSDRLFGGDGRDILKGGEGDDFLWGEKAATSL